MSETSEQSNPRHGYKTVLIGPETLEIPEEWVVTSIDDVASRYVSGGTPDSKTEAYWGGKLPWTTAAVVEGPVFAGQKDFITQSGLENSASSIVPKGGILFGTRVNVGNVGRANKDVAISQDLTGIILDENKIATDFVVWYLMANQTRFKDTYSQGSTIQGMLTDDLRSLPLLYPPLSEQRRIAEILSTVDELIHQTDAVIEETKRLKRGLMQDLLTQGIGNESHKRVQIGPKAYDIPQEWNIATIPKLCSLDTESFDLSKHNKDTFEYIDIDSVSEGTIEQSKTIPISDAPSRAKQLVKTGDVLVGKVRPYLQPFASVTKPYGGMVCSTGFAVLSARERVLPSYIAQVVLSKYFIDQMTNRMTGTSYPAVNKSDFKNIRVFEPPLPEQRRIAGILSTVDDTIQKEHQIKTKLETLKHGLMQDLLTGKVRVPVES